MRHATARYDAMQYKEWGVMPGAEQIWMHSEAAESSEASETSKASERFIFITHTNKSAHRTCKNLDIRHSKICT